MTLISDPYEEFLIDYLIERLESGSNTKQALELYISQIPSASKFKKKLEQCVFSFSNATLKLEAVFYENGIINSFEYGLIKHCTSTIDGLKLIRSLHYTNSNLLIKMIYPIFTPLIILLFTFYGLNLYLHILDQEMTIFTKINSLATQFVDIPYYLNYTFINIGLTSVTFILITILFGYIYAFQFKPFWIYKIFKTQAYSDGRFLFKIINEMLKVGMPLRSIANVLGKDYGQVGLRLFFIDLEKAIDNGQPIYKVFEKYNFPTLLVIDIKISELNQNTYLKITENLTKTCNLMFDRHIEYVVMQWYLFFWTFAFAIIVIVGSDMINLLVSSFTFKMLYD
jgi:hypothetical protein